MLVITDKGLEKHLNEDVVVFNIKDGARVEGKLAISNKDGCSFVVKPLIGVLFDLYSGRVRVGIYRNFGSKKVLVFHDYFSL